MLVVGPVLLFGCFSAVRLGNRLPHACRKLGHRMGMTYNYLRLLVKLLAPEEETALKVLSIYNKSNQQMNALSRELSENMFQVKKSLTDSIPQELQKNPFDGFSLEDLKKAATDPVSSEGRREAGSQSGVETLYQGLLEKRKIATKRAQDEQLKELTKLV